LGAEIAVDEVGDQLSLGRLQLERGAAELLRRRRRQPHEQGRGGFARHLISEYQAAIVAAVARRAFLLGGSGQTGRALIPRLQERGWEVSIGSRGERDLPQGLEHLQVDRADTAALKRALGDGVDVLVDFVAFEGEHAEQLLSLRDHIGSLVVLSRAAVYFEAEGPPKDDAAFPRLPVPLSERSPTAPPAPAAYATKKAAIEQLLPGQDEVPSTLLRAGAIHGPWSSWAREWHFVKRVLDDR